MCRWYLIFNRLPWIQPWVDRKPIPIPNPNPDPGPIITGGIH